MSDEEFEKYDSLDDLSFDNEKDSSDLDEYGVWVKKKPDALENASSLEERAKVGDDMDEDSLFLDVENEDSEGEAFDFDGLSEEVSMEDEKNSVDDKKDASIAKEKEIGDASFDDIDMSDFFTDFDSEENKEEEAKEEEVALKMELNFDNVDSYDEGALGDDFDSMLDEAASIDGSDTSLDIVASSEEEIDELLSSSPSSTSFNTQNDDSGHSDISLDVMVDEAQDFTKMSSEDEEDSLIISPPIFKNEENTPKEDDKEDIVIKSTVIEPENIEEIKKENKKVLGEDSMEENAVDSKDSLINNALNEGIDFNDVDALAKDLTDDSHNMVVSSGNSGSGAIQGFVEVKKVENVLHVEGLDRLNDLASSMLQELASIKNEIASLKQALPKVTEESRASTSCDNVASETEADETGFFKDEDTDEAIALTGDELNNILITADFTEESANDVDTGKLESREEVVSTSTDDVSLSDASHDGPFGECEICDDDDSFGDEFDFDNIALENAKLDDFVIPDELDYNMLRNEGNEDDSQSDSGAIKAEGEDMSYLDEKDGMDSIVEDVTSAPKTQDLPVSSKDEASDATGNEALPSNIKKDIKSVLSYMDQLLESLPEDKMKEFAESEYFEMYNRLFSELGIS